MFEIGEKGVDAEIIVGWAFMPNKSNMNSIKIEVYYEKI